MKTLIFIALVAFLGTVAVQGYGPREHYKHGPPHRPPPRPLHHGPSDGPHHHGPPDGPGHWSHGPYRRPPLRPPHHGNFRPPWDDSPDWDDDGPDDSDSSGPSDEYSDSSDWHHHTKRPWKKFPSTTAKPTPSHKPPQTPRPPPQTTRPPPQTTRPPPQTTRPTPQTTRPPPQTTQFPPQTNRPPWTQGTHWPRPTGTAWTVTRPNPTPTTWFTLRPTRTIGPTSRPTGSTGSVTRTTWHPNTPTEETTHWITTTSAPEPTKSTTLSPETEECIQSCLSTSEYNPVCGTNGITYSNEGKLLCAKSCGVDVSIRRRSACPPPQPTTTTNNNLPTINPRPTTSTPSIGRTTPSSSFNRCMKECHMTGEFKPVCGTDLVTYMNMNRLKCAQSCGEVVQVLCEKPCAACGFNPVSTVTPSTTTFIPTTTGNVGKTTVEPDIKECIEGCPTTPENNPVCGTNSITYKNPSHLLCAQLCGVSVIVARFSPCSTTTATPSTTTTDEFPITTLSPDIQRCIRRCPVTSEYNPVCGTNGHTYSNIGHLECAKFCGTDVELKYKSSCTEQFNPPPDSTLSPTTESVHGIKDRVTTSSRATLMSTSRFTTPSTMWTTTGPTTPIPTLTTTSRSVSTSTLGFSIPPYILDLIFESSTTQQPATNPDDDDEDFNINPRFNNDNITFSE